MSVITLDEAFPEARDPKWLKGLEKEFRWGVELEKVRYMARQLEARKQVGKPKMIDGLGQLTHTFDARTYFRWLEVDPYFWDDPSNMRKYEQDNSECKVESVKKTRIMT